VHIVCFVCLCINWECLNEFSMLTAIFANYSTFILAVFTLAFLFVCVISLVLEDRRKGRKLGSLVKFKVWLG